MFNGAFIEKRNLRSSSRLLKLRVKYFENGDRHDDEVNGSRIGHHPWVLDWMTLNSPSSRSLILHLKYFEKGVWDATALGRYTFHRTCFLFYNLSMLLMHWAAKRSVRLDIGKYSFSNRVINKWSALNKDDIESI